MMSRLHTVAPDLVELIESADDTRRRSAAIAAAEWALATSGLDDQMLRKELDAVRSGRVGDVAERTVVKAASTALDDRQWDIQDQLSDGKATVDDHLRAFGKARAATAVLCCGEQDARIAALEAVYEASAVTRDFDALRSVVVPILTA